MIILYYRSLAGYDDLTKGKNQIFGGDDKLYFGMLGLMLFLYFLLSILKTFFLYLYVL